MGHLYKALFGHSAPSSPLLTILPSCIPKWAYPTVPYSIFQRSVSNSFEFYLWGRCEQPSFHYEIGAKCCKWVALFLYQRIFPWQNLITSAPSPLSALALTLKQQWGFEEPRYTNSASSCRGTTALLLLQWHHLPYSFENQELSSHLWHFPLPH